MRNNVQISNIGHSNLFTMEIPSDNDLKEMKRSELIQLIHATRHNYNALVALIGTGTACI